MELTKIHVKGKRKTPATSRPQALCEQQPPFKAPRTRKSLSSVMATRKTRHRNTLDSLPAEILENILLYSANLALPRVSNFIGAKLSGRATLLRLFILAFHETWEQWFGIPTNPAIVHGPWLENAQHVPCRGDPKLQVCPILRPIPCLQDGSSRCSPSMYTWTWLGHRRASANLVMHIYIYIVSSA